MKKLFRLLHITDSHLGDNKGDELSSVDCDASLNEVMLLLKRETFDAILITGDIAHNGAISAYQRLQNLLSSMINVPVYLLPGNHDDLSNMQAVFGHWQRETLLGDWQLILLDSNAVGQYYGYLADSELSFLENTLRHSSAQYSIIALHHPPVDIGSAWMDAMQVRNKQAFFDIIDRYDSPRIVIWGHIHQAFDQTRDGVRLVSSPSTCTQFLPETERHKKDSRGAGYRWLELGHNGEVETGIVRVRE